MSDKEGEPKCGHNLLIYHQNKQYLSLAHKGVIVTLPKCL